MALYAGSSCSPKSSQVDEYLAFATSAIREAGNGGDFIRHLACEISIDIRAIPGHFEAHLIYKVVREAVELPEPTDSLFRDDAPVF
jgi:exopolyphosphatase/guanosine-5'-triphosphate,3'-diphosphate pyrophosphatase